MPLRFEFLFNACQLNAWGHKPPRYVKLRTGRKHKLSKHNWTVEFEGVHLSRVYRVWAFNPDHRFALMNLAISFEICELAFLRDTNRRCRLPLITPLYTLGGVRIHPTKPPQAPKLVSKPPDSFVRIRFAPQGPQDPESSPTRRQPLKQRQGTPEAPVSPSTSPTSYP